MLYAGPLRRGIRVRVPELEDLLSGGAIVCLAALTTARLLSIPMMPWVIPTALAVSALTVLQRREFRTASSSWLDAAVLLLWIAEVPDLLLSSYPRNSFEFARELCVGTVIYLLLKAIPPSAHIREITDILISALTLLIVSPYLYRIFRWAAQARALEFEALSDLKSIAPVAGTTGPNDWATVALLLLPFCLSSAIWPSFERLLFRLLASVACIILLASLLMTFSRGAYIGLGLFWAALVFLTRISGLSTSNVRFAFLAFMLLAILLASFALRSPRSLAQVLSPRPTLSQIRSAHARLPTWRIALSLCRKAWLFGVGANNFAIQGQPIMAREGLPAVSRTQNLGLQILVERGIVGVCSFGAALWVFSSRIRKRMRSSPLACDRGRAAIVLAAVIGVFARELSYSSLLTSSQAFTLFALLLSREVND
jgi:O-antigen ligase